MSPSPAAAASFAVHAMSALICPRPIIKRHFIYMQPAYYTRPSWNNGDFFTFSRRKVLAVQVAILDEFLPLSRKKILPDDPSV